MSDLSLVDAAQLALDYAAQTGADQAEASLHRGTGMSVTARQQELETVEKHNDAQIVVTVFKDHCTGSASSADLSEQGVRDAVDAAQSIARFTGSDECFGLADKELLATAFTDLQLDHPWQLDAAGLSRVALECEAAAMAFDARINNSEGASVSSYSGSAVYANSHGFLNEQSGSQHSLSCAMIAADDSGMQRDYWYDSNRNAEMLEPATEIGQKAARRTIDRLGARKIKSTQAPVLFEPAVAKSLIGHMVGAIKGSAIYKKASFMLDQVEQRVLPDFVTIAEHPHLPGGMGSAIYDNEGVATPEYRAVVEGGVLQNYVLGSYTARKLGLQTTANAGGVRNLSVTDTGQSFSELLATMQQGLLVTELIGSGINMVTGDYSRGAAGFWIEGGEIAYPVEEITIAGNLRDMYQHITGIGSDTDTRGNIRCGSILLENMTIAGS